MNQSIKNTTLLSAITFGIIGAALVLQITASIANAMSPTEDDATRPSIGRAGELFTIQFTPGSKSITVGLAGKPAMTLDSSRVTIFGKVYPLKGQAKQLKIVPVESHFEIVDELQPNEPVEFEVKDTKSKKTEKFKIEHHQP